LGERFGTLTSPTESGPGPQDPLRSGPFCNFIDRSKLHQNSDLRCQLAGPRAGWPSVGSTRPLAGNSGGLFVWPWPSRERILPRKPSQARHRRRETASPQLRTRTIFELVLENPT